MKSVYHLEPPNEDGSVHFLHITDTHLFSNPDECLLGINTAKSFAAVVEAVKQSNFAYSAILATGDFIQDHQFDGYRHFVEQVKPLAKPLFWVEGNHDSMPTMAEALKTSPQIRAEKQILAGNFWQILLLDTHIEDVPRGNLSEAQLSWLHSKLAEFPERYTLIVQHHNILPTNSAWLDQHSLQNSEALAEVLANFPKVKTILHGHIHQEVDAYWRGYRVLATPSTCIQFKPNCPQFTLDPLGQGWRELSLYPNGELKTQVRRLKKAIFLPNFEATHY